MKYFKSKKDVPDYMKEHFFLNRSKYNHRAITVLAFISVPIYSLLNIQNLLFPGIPAGDFWYYVHLGAFIFGGVLGLAYLFLNYLFSNIKFKSRFDMFYVFMLGEVMVLISCIDLNYRWDVSAFLTALLLLSTAIWLDFRVYSLLTLLMTGSFMAGMYFMGDGIYLTPEHIVQLIVFFTIAWFIKLNNNDIRIQNYINYKRLEQFSQEMEQKSLVDALTEVKNRYYLDIAYESIVAGSVRYDKSFTFVMIDIDFFKKINDTYGHHTGDNVLKSFAKILYKNIRRSDEVVRMGGEEFLLILRDADKATALNISDKLRGIIAEYDFSGVEEIITASFGVADSMETTVF